MPNYRGRKLHHDSDFRAHTGFLVCLGFATRCGKNKSPKMGSLKRDRERGLGHFFLLSFLSFFSNFLLVMSNLSFVILSL